MSEFLTPRIPAPELSRLQGNTPPTSEEPAFLFGPRASEMTIRDWFAGQALSAIVMGDIHATRYESDSMAMAYARKAYEYADAMARVREETGRS